MIFRFLRHFRGRRKMKSLLLRLFIDCFKVIRHRIVVFKYQTLQQTIFKEKNNLIFKKLKIQKIWKLKFDIQVYANSVVNISATIKHT